MFNYKRVNKPQEKERDDAIRVTQSTFLRNYLRYIAGLFEAKKEEIVIKGTGNVISKAISLATLIRHRFKGLHQNIEIGTMEMSDEYQPIVEGLDPVILKRKIPLVTITLSLKELNTGSAGYSAPLPDSEVTTYVPNLSFRGERAPGRRRFRGRSRFGRGGRRRFGGRGGYKGGFRGGYKESQPTEENQDDTVQGEQRGYGESRSFRRAGRFRGGRFRRGMFRGGRFRVDGYREGRYRGGSRFREGSFRGRRTRPRYEKYY